MSAEGTEEEEWLYGESATVISVAPAEVKPELDKIIPGASEDADATEGGEIPVSNDDLLQEGLDIEGLAAAEAPSRKRGLNDEDGPEPNEDGERSEGEAPGSDKPESGEEGEDSDSDDEEDSVQVVIGDFKGQGALTAKRTGGPPPDKKGKFSTEDFESSGQINGVPAHEFSLDAIDEKPWRKPGADITDYFNYGFTEDTWRAYCDRQRRLRYESGTTVVVNSSKNAPQQQAGLPVSVIGEGRKYGGDRGQGPQNIQFPKRMQGDGPGMGMGPPGMRNDGMMGMGPPGMGMGMGMGMMQQMPMGMRREDLIRENSIQVMTADRREYSRKPYDMGPMGPGGPGPFDMSVPPPSSFPNRDFMGGPPPDFYNHPPPQEYYVEDEQPDYEEQQWMDSQWEMEEQNLRVGPSSALVVPLTKVAVVPPPPGDEDLPSSPATDVEKKVNPEPK